MEVNENGVVFAGRMGWIQNTPEAFRNYMGTPVKVVSLTEKLVVITRQKVNEDTPVNRALVRDGNVIETFNGNLICVRQDGKEFRSIQDEDVDVIRKFLKPVFSLDGQIIIQKDIQE